MKVFIWEDLDVMSRNYHPEGGLVVVAGSLEEARKALQAPENGVPKTSDAHVKDPIAVYETPDPVDPVTVGVRVFAFPNAGCC